MLSLELSIAIPTAIVSGAIRGYSGFASGLFLVPVFAIVFGPIEGISIAAVASCIGGLQLIPQAFKTVDWKELLPPLIAAGIACFFGVGFLVSNEPDTIKNLMGVFLIFASFLLLSGWKYNGPHNMVAGIFAGSLSGGALGGLGIPAGQFFALYFVSADGDSIRQRSHIVISAGFTITFFLFGLIFQGKVVSETIYHATFVTPVFLLGVWAGSRLFQSMPLQWFPTVVAWLVAATGIAILFT